MNPLTLTCLALASFELASAAQEDLPGRARDALAKGVRFFREHVAIEGTYLWAYSEDLKRREGEGIVDSRRGWVQPPGTPAVGLTFLDAHRATGEASFLDAAIETARGLIRGQLRSGGWHYSIAFDPAERARHDYRQEPHRSGTRNTSTLDDDTTQAAVRFLMELDLRLEFKNGVVHEAVLYALDHLLQAQHPIGAWPQTFDGPPPAGVTRVERATYPDAWSRQWPEKARYQRHYTLNDNLLPDLIETLQRAAAIYATTNAGAGPNSLAERCRAAIARAGRFILIAQMPEPQPAWAQQYDTDLRPAWARKFEPPAVTGGESQGILRTLLGLYRDTGDRRYLEPIPRALDYLRRSRLPDGRLARFYELRSNRPLFFTKDYVLTYDDTDLPTHYAFKVRDDTGAIAREYDRLERLDGQELERERLRAAGDPPRRDARLIADVQAIIAAQDDQGRWLEPGPLRYHQGSDAAGPVIRSSTFIRNVRTLSRYLEAGP